jgi:hypothetical protein
MGSRGEVKDTSGGQLPHTRNPFSFNEPSSSRSSRSFSARTWRFSRVSRPWIVFAAAQCSGSPPASSENHRSDGSLAGHALTFKLDHSMGADQRVIKYSPPVAIEVLPAIRLEGD